MNKLPPEGSLNDLLEKLHNGDLDVAEEIFLAYEPYLRLVVRRQLTSGLRSKFDSLDIVQSVWVDLLKGFRESGWRFPDADHLQAFLVKATRNRFIDRFRQHKSAMQREEPISSSNAHSLAGESPDTPTAKVHAEELWDRLVQECPPAHRDVLALKRQGFTLDEIADKTGLHAGSVRRILYELADRMARREKRETH